MNRSTRQRSVKRLDPVKTRTTILDASFHEFAANGYSGASIANIAAAAGVPKSLVQYHFGTKEELFQACVAQRAAPFLAVLDRFVRGEADVEEMIRTRFHLLRTNPDIQRLLAWASLSQTPFPTVFAERAPGVVQRFDDDPLNPQLLRLLFLIATSDGWFLFRNLYRNLAGNSVFDPEAEDQLLQSLLRFSRMNEDVDEP